MNASPLMKKTNIIITKIKKNVHIEGGILGPIFSFLSFYNEYVCAYVVTLALYRILLFFNFYKKHTPCMGGGASKLFSQIPI